MLLGLLVYAPSIKCTSHGSIWRLMGHIPLGSLQAADSELKCVASRGRGMLRFLELEVAFINFIIALSLFALVRHVPCIVSDIFSHESGFWRKMTLPFLSSAIGCFSLLTAVVIHNSLWVRSSVVVSDASTYVMSVNFPLYLVENVNSYRIRSYSKRVLYLSERPYLTCLPEA